MTYTEAEVFMHRCIRTKEEVGDIEDLDSEQRNTQFLTPFPFMALD